MESLQNEAILLWMKSYDVTELDFVHNTDLLFDGHIVAKIYNIFSEVPIKLSSLKQISNIDDWVNIMINLKNISNNISTMFRQIGKAFHVDLTILARKKDKAEMFKFLRNLFIFAINSSKSDLAISHIKVLDSQFEEALEYILSEEIVKQKDSKTMSPIKVNRTAPENSKEINELLQNIASLEIKKNDLQKKTQDQSEYIRNSEINLENYSKKQEEFNFYTERYNSLIDQLSKIKDKKQSYSGSKPKENMSIIKKQAIQYLSENGINKEYNPDDIMSLSNNLSDLKSSKSIENENLKKQITRLIAEESALENSLNLQNQKLRQSLKKYITMCRNELKSTAIYDLTKESKRLRKVIKLTENDTEKIKSQNENLESQEIVKLHTKLVQGYPEQIQKYEERLDNIRIMKTQITERLERTKIHNDFLMHLQRVSKFKRCFC